MKKAHREAARILYEERNQDHGTSARELYVDLHGISSPKPPAISRDTNTIPGLHPEEAISYLASKLLAHQNKPSRPIYAITGTGHHSKNGRDKVNKAVRAFLNEWRYAFREFSVAGDRNNVGGILGIDPTSWDRSLGGVPGQGAPVETVKLGESTKVRILRHGDVEREAAAAVEEEEEEEEELALRVDGVDEAVGS
jgi:hypothetical protein